MVTKTQKIHYILKRIWNPWNICSIAWCINTPKQYTSEDDESKWIKLCDHHKTKWDLL